MYRTERVQAGSETRTRTHTERVRTGSERVKTGVRDLGNGYFEDVYEDQPVYEDVERTETYQEPVYRESPVYRKKIRYEVTEWTMLREEKAAGDDRSPAWPEAQLQAGEREGSRRESYEVLFRDPKGKIEKYAARDEAEWSGYEGGRPYRATVRPMGGIKALLGPAAPDPGETAPQPAPPAAER